MVQEAGILKIRTGGQAVSQGILTHIAISMRPKQWVKNLFVFAPLIFSKKLSVLQTDLEMVAAFLLFCLVSGAVYMLNDILDRRSDQYHPRKCERPIASGRLPVPIAITIIVFLFIISLFSAYQINEALGIILTTYILINFAYSKYLKYVVILDVFSIAAGFFLRILAGIFVAQAQTSEWAYVAAIFLTLFIGFGKRRAELEIAEKNGGKSRGVLKKYNTAFLDPIIIITSAGMIISYMLYTISDYAIGKFGTRHLLFTSIFVLYGLFRYLYLIYGKNTGDSPTDILLADRPLLVSVFLWAVVSAFIIYSGLWR
ncbi:MAG TPA: decaprenyl-phosphate phosphoribosyltransferase [Syntrophales bacterium]|jgi:4-hydroxybenzoate polyprenyltransferase|nr:decaprenyl-phosphate phosphoribosyltransferase [Syntrophales bacterium]